MRSAIRSSLSFDLLERTWLGVERRDEAVEVAPDLAQPHGDVAQLLRRRRELGRETLERRERALRPRRERRRSFAILRRHRLCGVRGSLGELVDVPEPLAPRSQLALVAGREAGRLLDQRLAARASRAAAASASRVSSS